MKKSKMENPALPYDYDRNLKIWTELKGYTFPTLVLFDGDGKILHHVISDNPPLPVVDGKIRKDLMDSKATMETLILETIAAVKAK